MILPPGRTFLPFKAWILNAQLEMVFDRTVSILRFSFHMLRFARLNVNGS
jgi:hypothetical protein